MKESLVKTTVAVGVAAALAGMSFNASAAGFAIIENSAQEMGYAFAGQTAAAKDLSTIWSNPAGMTRYEGRHFMTAIHAIDFGAEFKGTATAPDFYGLNGGNPINIQGGNGGDAGTTAPVANLYWLQQVNDGSTRLGIAVNMPFGLKTDYEGGWKGRYHATDSEVLAVNINPSLAWKFGKMFSFGVGASIQYFKAKLSQNLDSFNICTNFFGSQGDPNPVATCQANGLPGQANAATDSQTTVDADSWGMGLNVGFMFEPSERTRIGLQYRSPIRQELEGDATFDLNQSINFFPINAQLAQQDVKATMDLPANASIGVYHEFANRISIMADAMWTQWSSLENVVIHYPDPSSSLFQVPNTMLTLNWEDAWRYSLGLGVPAGQKVMLRFGLAYDETPVPSAEMQSPRVPDGDRTWYSFGLGWQLGKRSSIDFGMAYLDVQTPKINNTINPQLWNSANSTAPGYNLNGEYDASVWIGSFQYNVAFSAF